MEYVYFHEAGALPFRSLEGGITLAHDTTTSTSVGLLHNSPV